MDERPVSGAKTRPGWKLEKTIAAGTQGIVATGFGRLRTGRALFIELGDPGGAWLGSLQRMAPVTSATPPPAGESQDRAAAIAFTWTGLEHMGLGETALASFARPFREGMMQEDRLRRLGDRRKGEWLETVIEGGPRWSANAPTTEQRAAPGRVGAFDVPVSDPGYPPQPTPITVHALLLLYARNEEDATEWCKQVSAALQPHGARVVHTLPLVLDPNHIGISNEHFGFADGLSQPEPYDGHAILVGGGPAPPDPVQGVPLGEFLIGYENGHHERSPGPVVPGDDPRPVAAGLPPHPLAEGFFDLGLNGSYLVVRELKQDVAAFWNSMYANAARIREQDPGNSAHVTAEWLAERVIGRNRDGHLLCTPAGTYRSPDADGLPDNFFRFSASDPHGVGCPAGSHVRRANPRDALTPIPIGRDGFPDPKKVTDDERKTLLEAANNHRILRRGRKYGEKIADEREDDGEDRGLLFMCLNTDIARQFEFVQQTWLLNSNFATLLDETDPLIGPPGRMTIREEPLRRTVQVDTFVRMAGGDYFFLPSLPALAYLGML